jgi:hypothetical protein
MDYKQGQSHGSELLDSETSSSLASAVVNFSGASAIRVRPMIPNMVVPLSKMYPLRRVIPGLDRHDGGVSQARLRGKCNQTAIPGGIPRRQQKKDSEGRVNA